jgi:hypothetical protein
MGTDTVTVVSSVTDVSVRHLTPTAPEGKFFTTLPALPTPQVTPPPDGAVPTSVIKKVAHSLARPRASPTAAPAAAAERAPKKLGSATAERMPITATTIISSTRVKPFCMGFFFSRSFLSSSSCTRVLRVDCTAGMLETDLSIRGGSALANPTGPEPKLRVFLETHPNLWLERRCGCAP